MELDKNQGINVNQNLEDRERTSINQNMDDFEADYQQYILNQSLKKTNKNQKKEKDPQNVFSGSGLGSLKMNRKITKNYFIFHKLSTNDQMIQISLQLDDDILVKQAIELAVNEMNREIDYQGLSTSLEGFYRLYMATSKGKPKSDYGNIDEKQFMSQVNIQNFALVELQDPKNNQKLDDCLSYSIQFNYPVDQPIQPKKRPFFKYICFCTD